MKNHENTLKNHGNQPKTMKNHETTLKNHGNQPKTMKNHETTLKKLWKPTKNHGTMETNQNGWFLMVPGWFKSELSAGGAKWHVENTPKGTCLICILAQRSRYALPAVGWLWPSDDDDGSVKV